MTPIRTPRVRRGAAVAVVLAVTGGGLATAGPATAAVPSAVAASASVVVPYPKEGAVVVGAGTTGFLTWSRTDERLHVVWTRYDGTTAEPWSLDDSWITASRASDVIVRVGNDGFITLRDMATGQDVLSVRARDTSFVGAVGRTLFVKASDSQGGDAVHLLAQGDDGKVGDRVVTGLPATATDPKVRAATPDTALLTYTTPTGAQWATVDLATAEVTDTGAMTGDPAQARVALSGTHVAWMGPAGGGFRTAVVAERKPGTATQRITLPGAVDSLGLVGGWLTYGQTGGYEERNPSSAYAVTARSLANGTTRKLMDDSDSSAVGPDGSLLVQGGTVQGGEGLYRIAPGANGEPAATQVASSGLSTKVTLLGHAIPAVVDLDRTGGRLSMVWQLSRSEVEMTVRIRNTRTGETLTDGVYPLNGDYDPHRAAYTWNGQLTWNNTRDMWTGAPSGPYTWEITAKPLNGIGPELKSSGAFTVTRKPGAHDYDADGSPDVLVRDTTGRLWIDDTFPNPYEGYIEQNPGLLVGAGWGAYDRIEAVGNIAGSAVSDVVARDKTGVLWLYQGTGNAKAPLGTRVRIGSGWGAYTRLTGGSDLTGDGRADLVATDKTGGLYLYKGTGSATAPFGARKKIGTGWGAYNQLTATGNLAGAPAGDLVARDTAGVLWLYLGKGDGTFAPRVRVGAGWGTYDRLLGVGDANRDGRPDLYASVKGGGGDAYVYKGTGSWKQPFGTRGGVSWYSADPDIRYDLLS
ncbi:FG-GAP repeat domain-containing protein [Streptomyces flavochromogenes]|uniref:FG-GAP repeat domain-containing protein n=1 Tax=Streptomyces flavochromogenes TaxID=68199 RepID=UPI0005643C1F|nr:VCBS repeat-containing protein [Streptomyces flavochromogenes]